jgi:hypothetical protein
MPRDPNTLQDVNIDGVWATTGGQNGERFLLDDNGVDADERIIIFATDNNLRRLSQAEVWFMDGTFSSAPNIFMQLYVILVKSGDLIVPAVFALLQRKTQTTYQNLLRVLVEKCEEQDLHLDPDRVVIDFEAAVINAIPTVLGNGVIVQGCFFHLCQSTFRKVQQLGMVQRYAISIN